MKPGIAFLLMVFSFQAKAIQDQFVLTGTVTNAPVKILYLKYTDKTGKEVLDSSQILNESFSFKGTINHPTRALLRANRNMIPDNENLNITPVYLEPTVMKVRLSYNHFKDAKVSGSKTHQEYEQLTTQQTPVIKEIRRLEDSLAQTNQQNLPDNVQKHIRQSVEKLISKIGSISYRFIRNHPDSWISADQLSLYKNSWPIDSVRYLFNRLSPVIQQGEFGRKVADKISVFDQAKASIGAAAIDFSAVDLEGKPIKLSDFKGRYVLLDFWGSWCVPCRAGNPHLLVLYEKYRGKGVEFIGVACQDTPVAWRKAIEKDGIGVWKHVLDSERIGDTASAETSIRKRYAVDSFPTKLLIDPTGVVVGRYGGNDETALDTKMQELIK